jgi:hypothetical protein
LVFAIPEYRLGTFGRLDEWGTGYAIGHGPWILLVDDKSLCFNRFANVGALDLASVAGGPINVSVLESAHSDRFGFRRIILRLVAIQLNYSKEFTYH